MRDVTELIDALDLAVARAEPVVAPKLLERAASRSRELRNRRGFLGETLVLAIAGGTGVGKSSLVNALAGEELVSVSALRPHTEQATAILPEEPESSLLMLLDALAVYERRPHPGFSHLAVIDLPDMDSVVGWHRSRVEELIPQVDGVIWVFDAEKYADRTLHEDFLAPLDVYRDQFTFVLNKIDRLRPEQLDEVRHHLDELLGGDGYPEAEVFTMAADPPTGRRRGVELLREHLTTRLDHKRTMLGKLVADTLLILRDLGTGAGVWDGAGLDLEERWAETRRAVADRVLAGSGAASRDDAACRIEDLVATVAAEVGADYGEAVRGSFGAGIVAEAVERAAATATAVPAPRGRRRGTARAQRQHAAEADLDVRVGRPLAELLWDRALFGATVAYAGLAAYQLADRIRRST